MRATIGRNSLTGILLFVLTLLSQVVSFAADPPAAKERSTGVEYARIYSEIAQLNLQSALRINQRNPDTLPNAQIRVLQDQVALAQEWLREAEDTAAGKVHNSAVVASEILLAAAEAEYANVLKLNQVLPQSRTALEKARLKVELAKLRMVMAKQVDATSPLAVLQFQVERLRETISDLVTQQVRIVDLD